MPSLPAVSDDVVRSYERRSLTRRLWHQDCLPADLIETLWRGDIDRLLYSSTPLQVKDRCIVARVDHSLGPLLLKQHTWGGAWRTFRSGWREASARRCGRISLKLHACDIPTPLPRAWLEDRIGPFGYRSYLLTDFIPGTTLYRLIRFGSPAPGELRHLARQVAQIWQRLVEAGISHNDMKPENFIVDEQLSVWLIDHEKVRFGGKSGRQQQRHVGDVKNFLHIRSWHRRTEARQVFLEEFCNTHYAHWLGDPATTLAAEQDATLSVRILCDDSSHESQSRHLRTKAIDSVHDIADEIVLVTPGNNGQLRIIHRIEPLGAQSQPVDWILVLHQDECVTPFLAKQLQQRIAAPSVPDALRIAIEPQYFGRSLAPCHGNNKPIRLFRANCAHTLANGEFTLLTDPQRTGTVIGTIQKCFCPTVSEYVDRLNDQSSHAATQRLQNGEKPKLFHTIWRAFARFLKSYRTCGGLRSGWTSLQIALLEAAFIWLEEAKLYQKSAEFTDDSPAVATAHDNTLSISDSRFYSPSSRETPQRKAA